MSKKMQWFLAAITAAFLSAGALSAAQGPAGELYVVTLADRVVGAHQLAEAYGGAIVEAGGAGSFTLRITPERARKLVTDGRVRAVVPLRAASAPAPGGAVAAQSADWSSGVAYAYDGAGNIRSIGSDTYVYDVAGRIVQGSTNGVVRRFEYDGFGNRQKCQVVHSSSSTSDCQYGYSIHRNSNRASGPAYDAAGNVISFAGHTYAYDAVNMQTWDQTTAITREYIYTPGDERIAVHTVGQSWLWTVRDSSGKVLREFASNDGPNGPGTANWRWVKDYIWRDGLLLATRQSSGATVTTLHYHLDHLGSPRRITDASDQVVGVHDYIPFGPEASGGTNEPSLTRMKYTGHERDGTPAESWDTLDYMHARYYSPALGRFLSIDPILGTPSQPQSWNRYAYALNNPLKYVDPAGMDETAYSCDENGDNCYYETTQSALEYTAGDTAADFARATATDLVMATGFPELLAGIINEDAGQAATGLAKQVLAAVPSGAIAGGTRALGTSGLISTGFSQLGGASSGAVLSGHGAYVAANGMVTLPEGTSLTVFTRPGGTITDGLGNAIETGASLRPFAAQMTGARSYLPGSQVPNLTLYPPGGLNIMGNPITVSTPTTLNSLLVQNMGNVRWAACLTGMPCM